jgi:soluble lytic murein transglycosylase-like protein
MTTAQKQPSPEIAAILSTAATAHGIPENILKAVAYVESRFDPTVTSAKGAAGLMQIMFDNWQPYGITDPYDPTQSANGGAKMLKKLYEQFTNDWPATLAAYNWGPARVRRNPRPQDWPESVRQYVVKVLTHAGIEPPFQPTRSEA